MKKLLSATVLFAFITSNLFAQTFMEKPTRSVPNKILIQVPSTPPAPAPAPTMSKTVVPISNTNVPASVYSLTSARVNIRTGADNKEFPSEVVVWLISKGVGYALEQPMGNLESK